MSILKESGTLRRVARTDHPGELEPAGAGAISAIRVKRSEGTGSVLLLNVSRQAINPDRIRSGLLTDAMFADRSRALGVDETRDVAQAFVFAARMGATTGAVITVDGGNVAAMVR